MKKIVNHFHVLSKLSRLIFRKSMRHSNYLSTIFSAKIAKHEKYRVLLTFDGLSKNVKNAILTYNSTHFKGVDSFK